MAPQDFDTVGQREDEPLLDDRAVKPRGVKLNASDFVYLVCAGHLIICTMVVACTTTAGDKPVVMGGVLIYPFLQCANTAFACISIVSIIAAGIGNLYLIESHLNVYFYVLLLSVIGNSTWIGVFIAFGRSCRTLVPNAEHLAASVQCGFPAASAVVALIAIVLFQIFGLAAVSRARRAMRIKYSEEILPYLRKSLEDSIGTSANFDDAPGAAAPMTSMAPGFGPVSSAMAPLTPVTESVSGTVPVSEASGNSGRQPAARRMGSSMEGPIVRPAFSSQPAVTAVASGLLNVGPVPAFRSAPSVPLSATADLPAGPPGGVFRSMPAGSLGPPVSDGTPISDLPRARPEQRALSASLVG